MHPTSIFRLDDREKSLTFIEANPFALLAVNGENGPVTALVPLVLDRENDSFLGHVARANPFWEAAQKTGKAVAVFRGPDAYVSPSNYPSKKEHGRAVPTWNYVALEVRGDIHVETDPSQMEPFLKALTDKMEARRDDPWQISDAPEDYIEKLSRGIVGFRMNINNLTHVRKISQNKSAADQQGIINDFEKTGQAAELALSAMMKE